MKTQLDQHKLRCAVALLRIHNAWREGNRYRGVLQYEPEPKKFTAALELVTGHCMRELNLMIAERN